MLCLSVILGLVTAAHGLTVPNPAADGFSNIPGSTVRYKDCGVDNVAWIRLDKFGMTPPNLHLPGAAELTMHGHANHEINNNVVLDVQVYKQLLSSWTHVPCTGDLGSCQYADVCHFMQVLFPGGNCPDEFQANGLPCTCPFHVAENKVIDLEEDVLSLPEVKAEYTWLSTGKYYLKMIMYEKGLATERMCLEFFVDLVKG